MRCLVALLWTALGWFVVVDGMTATFTPDPEFQGYWRREPTHPVTGPSAEGMLLITVGHRPFAVLPCRLVTETTARGETVSEWECR